VKKQFLFSCHKPLNKTVNPTKVKIRNFNIDLIFQDNDSGLRTLTGRDWYDRQLYDVFWSYNNFILGSKLPAQYSFQASYVYDESLISLGIVFRAAFFA
jgi:hypothetical protein